MLLCGEQDALRSSCRNRGGVRQGFGWEVPGHLDLCAALARDRSGCWRSCACRLLARAPSTARRDGRDSFGKCSMTAAFCALAP